MKKVGIFVVAHKPVDVLAEDLIPIHVGRASSDFKEEMADYVGDDTGLSNRLSLELSIWVLRRLKINCILFCVLFI